MGGAMYGQWLVLHQVLAFVYMLGTTITLAVNAVQVLGSQQRTQEYSS